METKNICAALFDLDGVVFDTEPQYTIFWGEQFRLYYPESVGLENKIKGQTLVEIYDGYFSGELEKEREVITKRLNDFEKKMDFVYVDGFKAFINSLRINGVKTAVVTSSNLEKMASVYERHPDFKSLFDAILTSEDFERSKPDPDCYNKAAARLKQSVSNCVVFEDSFNGLRSGRAAGMPVFGLSTTNAPEAIKSFCDVVIADYTDLDYEKMCEVIAPSR